MPIARRLEGRIVEFLHPPEDRAEVKEREQKWQERLERAQELYLAGDISRDRCLEEKGRRKWR